MTQKVKKPETLDGILADLRQRMTPKDDPYSGKDAGVFLYNCGWVAYYGDFSTMQLSDESFKTSYDAAAALWKYYLKKILMKEVEE